MKKALAATAWLTIFAVLVALTGLAAAEIDRTLTARLEALKSGAMGELERIAGRSISYGAISPSIFRSMNIRDLAIHDARGEGRTLLTIHEVRVYYSLVRLLFRRDPLGAIREIRLLNSRFNIDMEKDSDVVDLVRRLVQSGGSGSAASGGLRARLTGSDIDVTVVSQGSSVDLRHLFFQVDAQSQAIGVSMRGDVAGRVDGGFSFTSSLKAQGTLDRSLAGSDATIRLDSFASSFVNTGAHTLQLVWKGSSIDLRKIQDRAPIALDMTGDLEKREFTVHFQSQDLRLDRLFSFSRPLARYENWLRVPITSSGHFTYRDRTRTLEYQADVSAFMEDQLPVHGVTLSTSVRGTDKEAFFQPLRLSSDAGTAEFAGSVVFDTLYPSGLLSLADVDTGSGDKINASLSIDRLKGHLDVRGSHLEVGELGFDAFQLSLTPSPSGAFFTLSTSFAGSAPEDLLQASGEVHLGRSLDQAVRGRTAAPGSAPTLNVAASLKNVPPSKLYHLLVGAGRLSLEQQDVFNLLARYSVSTEASLTTDFTNLSVAARSVTVSGIDEQDTTFRFGLAVDKSHLSLTGFNGSWNGINIQGGFEGDIGDGGQIGFASNLILLGTSYFFTGRYSQSAGLSATGSFGLAISAIPIRGGGALVKLKGEKFPLPLQGGPAPVSFDIAGLVTQEGDWSANVASITFHEVQLPQTPHAVVQLSGRLSPRELEITRMSVTDSTSTLVGSARADIDLPENVFDPQFLSGVSLQGAASLRTADGTESYSAKGGLAGGAFTLAIQADGVPVQRLGVSAIQGTLSATGTVNGPIDQPSTDMTVTLKQGRLGSDPLSLQGRLLTRPDGIEVKSISAVYLAHRLSGGEGTLDLGKRTFSFKGQFQTEVFSDIVAAAVGLEGSFSRQGAPLEARLFDLGLQGKLSLGGIRVNRTDMPAWAVAFKTSGGKISLDGGPGNSIHGWIDPQLNFSASLVDPLPITGALQGRIAQDRIHVIFDADSLDLLLLNSILKSPPLDMGSGSRPAIHFTAGVASGRLIVDGEINDPDFTGRLDIVGGGILTAYSPEEAGPVRTSLVFDGKGFHIPKTFATAGSTRLSAEAKFTIDHWIPLAWDISLTTESQTALRMRVRFGILNTEGSVSGNLHVSGDDRKTTIGGALVVSDCRITLGKAPDAKFVPEESPTYANVTVQTGRRVDFSWPSEDLPVVRTNASPGGTIAITYRGDTGAFTVKGGIGVQGGEVYYFDRSFIMKKGSIAFNEDQATFDPWITAHAEVREWDPSTSAEVRIFLDADSPFSKFSPRFSSDPPRADADILAMIGAPLVNRAETQGIGMAAGLVYSDILSQSWILRPFEQKVRQVLNLDMFSVRTQIIQNLVAQKVLGTTLNPLDNTSVSLGKYLGNDLFLEMLVRLQQPQIPVAVITPGGGLIAASTGLQPDFELSLEWATPFFLLDWSFLPKHPETLFLSDNSLSFSWRITY